MNTRPQLQRLHDLGYPVVVIDANECLMPNRWVYCSAAAQLFCHTDMLEDARSLWPLAQVSSANPILLDLRSAQ